MKKVSLFIFIAACVLLVFAGSSYAWEGRMSGMGDPFGLVQDESDFLIHPAKIADGSGTYFYLDYKFSYTDVSKWNNVITFSNPSTGALIGNYPFVAAGSQYEHFASLGSIWALGPGRVGLFFQFDDRHGSYDGTDYYGVGSITPDTFSLKTNDISYGVKLLYGLPLGTWKIGTEIAFNHNYKDNFSDLSYGGGGFCTNCPVGARDYNTNTFPYMVPFHAVWNDLSFKASAETAIGPGVLTFTPRIATILHGSSRFQQLWVGSSGSILENLNTEGTLADWGTGADLWYRVKLDDTTTLPFVVRVDYNRMKTAIALYDGGSLAHFNSELENLTFEVGGGIDKDLSKGTKVASGLYYDYLSGKTMFKYDYPGPYVVAHNDYPNDTENRLVWKAAIEHALSSSFTGRIGLNAFYGWVTDRYGFTVTSGTSLQSSEDVKASGHRWGLGGSIGGSFKTAMLQVEPFIAAGMQSTSVHTKAGQYYSGSTVLNSINTDKDQWTLSTGVSVKF